MKHLTEAALALDGVERLREAAANPHYVLQDFPGELGDSTDAHLKHHWSITPLHEAGHSVATVLAGRAMRDVYVFVWPNGTHLGMSRPTGAAKREWTDLLEEIGVHGSAREVVSTFAGPAAELRADARMIASGLKGDRERAEAICKFAEFEGVGERFEWQEQAWSEACRMFEDERVWSATQEIAQRLRRSTEYALRRGRVTGRKITEIVNGHLPTGWEWQSIFKRPF